MRRLLAVLFATCAACLAEPGAPNEQPIGPDPGHWSYRHLEQPLLPQIKDKAWPKNPIDHFVLAALEADHRAPSAEADANTLARRVSLDLAGLPAAEQIPASYEEYVDQLLASPHYGEHLAREWLDAARYADTHGYHVDLERTMWPWRDWVINAFNTNLSFDRFTIEQLAGDLLPEATSDQHLATAFNRNHPITAESGVIDEEFRIVYAVDRVSTLGTVWLGLTTGCARCHDHKFDPLTQNDFYALLDCFNHVPEVGDGPANSYAPTRKLKSPLQRERLSAIDAELAELETQIENSTVREDMIAWIAALPGQTADWSSGRTLQAKSEQGATLRIDPESTIVSEGENPSVDSYEIISQLDLQNIRTLRLEAMIRPELPNRGPGRGATGNFVLTEIEVYAESDGASTPITISDAVSDFEQTGFSIDGTFDGEGTTGWAIEGGVGRTQLARFTFAEPLAGGPGTRLRVRLRHEYGSSLALGHFRLSYSSDPAAGVDLRHEAGPQNYYLLHIAPSAVREKALRREQLDRERRRLAQEPEVLIMEDSAPRETKLLVRGDYQQPAGRPLTCAAPNFLPPFPQSYPKNRLGLAQWLVAPQNPLTARVIVNRYWRMIFGRGLVETVDDFGLRGDYPKHRELLDWLATEFIASGWNVKGLLRLMVTSATYRQSSQLPGDDRDPQNIALGRGPRNKLTAEQIRDQSLFVSGLLNPKIGGESISVRQPPGLWEELNDRAALSLVHRADSGKRAHRRSVYTFWKRTVPRRCWRSSMLPRAS